MAFVALTGVPDGSADGSADSLTAALPANIAAGDELLLAVVTGNQVDVTPPSGWDTEATGTMSDDGWAVLRRTADGLEGASVVVEFSASTDAASVAVRAATTSGKTVGFALSPTPAAGGSGTQPNPPSLDPDSATARDYTWFDLVVCSSQIATDASPSGYTLLVSESSGTGDAANLRISYRNLNAATEDPGEDECGHSTHGWRALTGAFWFVDSEPEALLSVASEVDTANALTVAAEPVIGLSLASEVDTAYGLSVINTPGVDLNLAREADTAYALTVQAEPVIALSLASEVDTAHSLAVSAEVAVEVAWVGAVTTTTAVVKTRLSGDSATLTVTPGGTEVAGVEGEDDVYTFALTGLSADTAYTVEVVAGAEVWNGGFKTFPTSGSFVFAAGGDSGHSGGAFDSSGVSPNAPTWDSIAEDEPLFFLHMGDLHYKDISSNNVALFRSAYQAALTGKASTMLRTVPIVYVWDDHDFGGNNSNGTDVAKPAAAQAYREYVPHYTLDHATGLWQTFTCGRVRFIITDGRSERSPNSATDNASKTLLGSAQKTWLDGVLDAATEELIVLVLPNPWIQTQTAGSDSWGGFSTERQEIAEMFTEHGVTDKMLILSADAHMLAMDDGSNSQYDPAVAAAGPRLAQLGGIDAGKVAIGGPYSEGEAAAAERNIYGLITVTDNGSSIQVKVEGYSVDGTTETLEQSMTFTVGQTTPIVNLSHAQEIDAAFDLIVANEPALALSLASEVDTAFALSLDNAAPFRHREAAVTATSRQVSAAASSSSSSTKATRREVDIR